jgi:hypothetical protein
MEHGLAVQMAQAVEVAAVVVNTIEGFYDHPHSPSIVMPADA